MARYEYTTEGLGVALAGWLTIMAASLAAIAGILGVCWLLDVPLR